MANYSRNITKITNGRYSNLVSSSNTTPGINGFDVNSLYLLSPVVDNTLYQPELYIHTFSFYGYVYLSDYDVTIYDTFKTSILLPEKLPVDLIDNNYSDLICYKKVWNSDNNGAAFIMHSISEGSGGKITITGTLISSSLTNDQGEYNPAKVSFEFLTNNEWLTIKDDVSTLFNKNLGVTNGIE